MRAADLCEAMLGDDHVSGVLTKISQTLFGLPLTFQPGEGRKTPVRDLEARQDWQAMFPAADLGHLLSWGLLLGVGVGELVW
jgi:hypothetical protein